MKRNIIWAALGLLTAYLLYLMLYPFVDVIVYSIFIYYVGRPIYHRLEKVLKSHALSAFVTLFLLLLPVTVIVVYGLGIASIELLNFMNLMGVPYAQTINSMIAEYSVILSEITPQDLMKMAEENQSFKDSYALATDIILGAMGIIFRMMLMFTIALYLMMDGRHMKDWLVTHFSPGRRDLSEKFFREIDKDLHKVFFGSILTAIFIAIMGSLVFFSLNTFTDSRINIPYVVLSGMLCGVTSLVPAVGVALFWVPAAVAMIAFAYMNNILFTDWWFIALFVASTAVLVDWGPNLLFKPRITGKRIHPGLMMMAYLLGPIAFGLAGLFIGPITLVVALNFSKIVLPKLSK